MATLKKLPDHGLTHHISRLTPVPWDFTDSTERLAFWEIVKRLPARPRTVCALAAQDYTQAEIGEMVGIDRRRVGEVLVSLRKIFVRI